MRFREFLNPANLLGRARPNARNFDGCACELERLEQEIPAISNEVAARYLNSSSMLDSLVNAGERLVKESEDLLSLVAGASGRDSGLTATAALLTPAFEYLERWRSDVKTRDQKLTGCACAFADVQRSETNLRQLVSPLAYIQTMFRIECAGLPEEIRQVFTGLTSEISKLHREVSETFGQQFAMLASTASVVDQIRTRIGREGGAIASALAQHKQQISATLSHLAAELARNAEREIELAKASREINDAVSRMVMALQVHDIASQRLQAIRSSLIEACKLIAARNGAEQDAWCLLVVQRAQLEDVQRQLEASEQTLQAATTLVASHVSGTGGSCVLLRQFQELTDASNTAIELSFGIISDVRGLLSGAIEFSKAFHNSMQPIGNVTNTLTNAVEQLSIRMRLIALNAQVQAVQIGTRTGLEVLAAQTAAISRETSAVARTISSGILGAVDIVQNLMESFQHTVTDAEATLETFERKLTMHREQLNSVRERTIQNLRCVNEAIADISNCSAALATESSVRFTALASLQNAVDCLAELDREFKRWFGRIDPAVRSRLTTGHYRMNDERNVHAKVMHGLFADTAPSLENQPLSDTPGAAPVASEIETQPLVELF